jgi:elongation factor G
MCVPIQIPLGEEKAFKGIVDLIQMKAYTYPTDGSGKVTEASIPADLTARAQEYRDKLVEAVAESDEKLMKSFSTAVRSAMKKWFRA